jgi:hypothetical protein
VEDFDSVELDEMGIRAQVSQPQRKMLMVVAMYR